MFVIVVLLQLALFIELTLTFPNKEIKFFSWR